MRFITLRIDNFQQFDHLDLLFGEGFTVIRGPNEAGKSTIQAALLAALYLDPSATDEAIAPYVRWGQIRRFTLALEFEDGGARYSLLKDFESRTACLHRTDLPGGDPAPLTRDADIARLMGEMLGATSMDSYVNTAGIRHDEVSRLPTAAPVSQRLQARVAGGRLASAGEVIAAIEEELAEMTSGGPRRLHETGVLRQARERIDALQRAHSALAAKLAMRQENVRLLARWRDELTEVEASLAERSAQLESSDRAQGLEEDCALLAEHRTELERAEAVHGGIGEAAEQLSGLDTATIQGKLQRARDLELRLDDLRSREAELSRDLAAAALTQLQRGPTRWAVALALAGAAIGLGSAVAIAALHSVLPALGVVVGSALIAIALGRGQGHMSDATRRCSAELSRCSEAMKTHRLELHCLLTELGLRTVEELALVARATHGGGEMRATRRQRIERLIGSDRAATRQVQIEQIGQAIYVRRLELEHLSQRRLSTGDYERVDQEASALRTRREGLLREIYRLEGEIRGSEVNSEALACLDEELSQEHVRFNRLERRRKVLESAHSGMREAFEATLAQASSIFRGGIARHLGAITGGRYDRVDAKIDEEGLHLLVYTADRHRAVRADTLSRATQDQIYLAARMALLELVCNGREPPLLLDDPFVNYDDARVEKTVSLLRTRYGRHQVLLFTFTDRYDRFADTVIALDGPQLAPVAPDVLEQTAAS